MPDAPAQQYWLPDKFVDLLSRPGLADLLFPDGFMRSVDDRNHLLALPSFNLLHHEHHEDERPEYPATQRWAGVLLIRGQEYRAVIESKPEVLPSLDELQGPDGPVLLRVQAVVQGHRLYVAGSWDELPETLSDVARASAQIEGKAGGHEGRTAIP